jgi:hypothetical protein
VAAGPGGVLRGASPRPGVGRHRLQPRREPRSPRAVARGGGLLPARARGRARPRAQFDPAAAARRIAEID